MYTNYFGLKKRPFILSPDPEFLYLSRVHDLAFTHLEYGLLHHAGFVALTGEVGTGKTTLLKYLFDKVKTSLEIAMIFNTLLDAHALLEMLVREFDLIYPAGGSKAAVVDTLFQHFMKQYSKGNRCVVVVDEAQNLPLEAFEELRMLSNLEVGSDILLQIILVGQPQLRERLAHPSLAQLTQRISVHYHLSALSGDEVGSYVTHRLKVAGYEGAQPLFGEDAVARLAQVSRGIPRIINSICDASLTYAFADEQLQVHREIIDRVIEDNELLLVGIRPDEPVAAADLVLASAPVVDAVPAAVPTDYHALLSRLLGRLDAVEMRMQALEADRQNGALKVLQEMLEKERERSFKYAQQIISMNSQYREVQSQLTGLRKELQDHQAKAKPAKQWRIFGREKTN